MIWAYASFALILQQSDRENANNQTHFDPYVL